MNINCNGILLELDSTRIMAILNVTPDSFFDGSHFQKLDKIKAQVDRMIEEGADIIDVGGMSSRPSAQIVEEEEEWGRIEPAIQYLRMQYPTQLISVDTIHSIVASRAIDYGTHLINDISAGQLDPLMLETVGGSDAAYVMMHMRGTPATMKELTDYDATVSLELLRYFKERIQLAEKFGITDLILDPGFGFAKTIDQNYEVLNKLATLRIFERPILAGLSRKSMICKVLGVEPQKALNGTSALHMIALQQGANMLRVHDVKEAKEVVSLYEYSKEVSSSEK